MSNPDAIALRQRLSGLAVADRFEREELRATRLERKLQQLWSLMQSSHLFDDEAERRASEQQMRGRWQQVRERFGR